MIDSIKKVKLDYSNLTFLVDIKNHLFKPLKYLKNYYHQNTLRNGIGSN